MQPGPQYPYAPPAPPRGGGAPTWILVLIVAGIGGVFLVGVLAALAIYGTRRYISSSKSAEAKNTIGAIARGARASYEREQLASDLFSGSDKITHAFCKSAVTVPATVPAGVKYQPSPSDFDTGDAVTGWRCLKFSMTQPIYYQYHYHQGSGYLAAAAPGPDGFEAAARGDLDGDGVTSLFSLTGSASGGTVTLIPTVHIENENE